MSAAPVKRKKLLKPRSQKYYTRKAKIEQALRSLSAPHDASHTLPSSLDIPSSAYSLTPLPQAPLLVGTDTIVPQDQEILAVPVAQSAWVSSATKIDTILLPRAFTQMSADDVRGRHAIFNMNVWNSLPPEAQANLKLLLPDFSSLGDSIDPQHELNETLARLFKGDTFWFFNPIEEFMKNMASQRYQPQQRTAIQREKLQQQYGFVREVKQLNYNMIQKIADMKEQLELPQTHGYLLYPPPRAQYTAAHLAREYEDSSDTADDSGGEEQTLEADSQKVLIEKLEAAVQRKGPELPEDGSLLGKRARDEEGEGGEPAAEGSKPTNSLKSLLFDDDTPPPEVIPPGPVWAFFPALRDAFATGDGPMALEALEAVLNTNEDALRDVDPAYTLSQFLQLGLHFLQAPPARGSEGRSRDAAKKPTVEEHSATTDASLSSILNPPDEEIRFHPGGPYVVQTGDMWRWIGPMEAPGSIQEELENLELLFYFAVTRGQTNAAKTQISLVSVKQQKGNLTIRPSTVDEIEAYHRQEEERYLAPELAYTFQFRNTECAVAPMKRGLGNQSQRPRDHPLLRGDRPPHISVLCLVRDAAARLPGGLGTRPDVALLVLDSQYVVQDLPEAKLNAVVSGALDRLHAQEDPCVRFDGDQKMWIYLHRRRIEANFEVTVLTKKKSRR